MKILHTSDWHLGKRLPPFEREDEQAEVMKEICNIAKRENVDVCLIAGDVFDVSVPPAKAEELFYSAVLELSRTCLVVAIAGNHDDGERLKAPDALAKVSGVLLVGGFDCSDLSFGDVEGRKGGLVYRKNGEKLNLALCPYLTESRRGDPPAKDYAEYVKSVLGKEADDVFSADGCNVLAAHLFMLGGGSGEERELGAAKLLPLSVLPDCDYVALGHIHKPMKLKDNVRYSGSVLSYSFDEKTKKQVIIFDTVTKEIREIPLSSGRELLTVRADSFDSALKAMKDAGENFVRLVYDCSTPLSASQTTELSAAGRLASLEIVSHAVAATALRRSTRTPIELFKEFYGFLYGGEQPSDELADEFLSLLGERE